MRDRVHFASKPIVLDDRDYFQLRAAKPDGLWFSIGESWLEWCAVEEFNLDALRFIHPVRVSETTRILHLCGANDIRGFTQEYQTCDEAINWPLVAQEWDGIEISPYVWECRLDRATFWYYGWDCASGCIWNLSGVTLGKPVDAITVPAIEQRQFVNGVLADG